MAASVYGAQHLIDGLFLSGMDDYAVQLLSSKKERSWGYMIYDIGTTITLEAWDDKFKPNQDWNHAWGAAPANLIPRRLMGITPLEPGFKKARIQPQLGTLKFAKIKHPTLLGSIQLEVSKNTNTIEYKLSLPPMMSAELHLKGEGEPRQIKATKTRQQLIFRVASK